MRTNHTIRKWTSLLVAVAAVMLGSCSTGGEASDPTVMTTGPRGLETTAHTAPAATTSEPPVVTQVPEPTSAGLEDEEERAAAEAVDQFWAEIDRLRQDPSVEVQELAEVARGQALTQWVSNIQQERGEERSQTGATDVTVTDVETVAKGERYEVTVCLDWSELRFNGVKPDRGAEGDRQQITYIVRPDATSDGELFVTDDPLEYEPCTS